jgi:CBS domain-containing protein
MSQADAYLEARLHRRRTVEDVMTTTVVAVDRLSPYKEIARLLAEHRVSSTIRPGATIAAATRAMTAHHVTSLPVTGADRQLIGIVSRRDLLSVFLRPDADIIREVRHLLDEVPFPDPADVIVTVRHGIVTLAGRVGTEAIRLIWDVDGVIDVVAPLAEVKD